MDAPVIQPYVSLRHTKSKMIKSEAASDEPRRPSKMGKLLVRGSERDVSYRMCLTHNTGRKA